ncbi:MAG: helix-turn-helix transcriptional regulator [Pirellulales bacterium]|nr:helix-turn-helix transcriptional regulator [Pirellulales bacterium]
MKTIDAVFENSPHSLDDLAAACGLAEERVAAILDGRWLPNPGERAALAAALGVDVAQVSWGHTMNPRNVRYHRYGLKEDFRRAAGDSDAAPS